MFQHILKMSSLRFEILHHSSVIREFNIANVNIQCWFNFDIFSQSFLLFVVKGVRESKHGLFFNYLSFFRSKSNVFTKNVNNINHVHRKRREILCPETS